MNLFRVPGLAALLLVACGFAVPAVLLSEATASSTPPGGPDYPHPGHRCQAKWCTDIALVEPRCVGGSCPGATHNEQFWKCYPVTDAGALCDEVGAYGTTYCSGICDTTSGGSLECGFRVGHCATAQQVPFPE
jgi:hypothetical protein